MASAPETQILEKQCYACKKVKPRSEFYKQVAANDGLQRYCKPCSAEWFKSRPLYLEKAANRYRMKYQDRVKENAKKWKAEHPETVKKANLKWRKENPGKIRELRNIFNEKIRSTPKGKLSHSIGTVMRHSLSKSKGGRHWETLVDFTVDQLKAHLEKQFKPGMTWENHGDYWHIDHKIPIAVFNYETPEDIDFKRCWSLKNLQPLEAKENMQKNSRLIKPFQPALLIE